MFYINILCRTKTKPKLEEQITYPTSSIFNLKHLKTISSLEEKENPSNYINNRQTATFCSVFLLPASEQYIRAWKNRTFHGYIAGLYKPAAFLMVPPELLQTLLTRGCSTTLISWAPSNHNILPLQESQTLQKHNRALPNTQHEAALNENVKSSCQARKKILVAQMSLTDEPAQDRGGSKGRSPSFTDSFSIIILLVVLINNIFNKWAFWMMPVLLVKLKIMES